MEDVMKVPRKFIDKKDKFRGVQEVTILQVNAVANAVVLCCCMREVTQ